MENRIEYAASGPDCTWALASRNWEIPTAPGAADGLPSSTSGIRKAPQALMNVRMAETSTPGMASGITTLQRIRSSLDPSIAAASSNSRGTWSMKFFSSQIANGTEVAASTKDVQKGELSQLNRTYIS